MLEVINNDYVRAARAKGLSEWTVIRRHVMRPALLPIADRRRPGVREPAFGYRSRREHLLLARHRQLCLHKRYNLDLPAIMGVSIVVAIVYIFINLLVDLSYSILDPRIELR